MSQEFIYLLSSRCVALFYVSNFIELLKTYFMSASFPSDKRQDRKKLHKNAKCPCESGKRYGNCCYDKIEYTYDEEGNILRSVELTTEAKEILEKQFNSFKDIFQREVVDDDPIFFEMLLVSEQKYFKTITELLRNVAHADEAMIYAHNELGFMVTKENKKSISDKDLKLWRRKIKEFRDIKSGKTKIKVQPLKMLFEQLEDWEQRVMYLYALILFKEEHNRPAPNLVNNINNEDFVLFCLTRHLKTMKAFRALSENGFVEDSFSLVRSMYENYLQVATYLYNPQYLQAELKAKVGIFLKTHKREQDRIVDIKTGESIKILNNKQRAALEREFNVENVKIYYSLYDILSSFVHPDIRTAHFYVNENFFSHNKDNSHYIAVFYNCFVNSMLMFDLIRSKIFKGQTLQDIKRFTKQIVQIMIETLDLTDLGTESEYKNRLVKMLKSKELNN